MEVTSDIRKIVSIGIKTSFKIIKKKITVKEMMFYLMVEESVLYECAV